MKLATSMRTLTRVSPNLSHLLLRPRLATLSMGTTSVGNGTPSPPRHLERRTGARTAAAFTATMDAAATATKSPHTTRATPG